MPEKSRQFQTDEFVAQRAAEANQARLVGGEAIARGITGGVAAYQEAEQRRFQNTLAQRDMEFRRDATIANLALRQRDQELSTHAQAFQAMLSQQELAHRQEMKQADIALKQAQQAAYAERTALMAEKAQLLFNTKMQQEQVAAARVQRELGELQLKAAKLEFDERMSAGRGQAEALRSISDLHSTLVKELDAYRDEPEKAPPALREALDRVRGVTMQLTGLPDVPRAGDREGAAKALLQTDALPEDVGGDDADVEALMRLMGGSTVIADLAENQPDALPQIAQGIAGAMPSIMCATKGDHELAAEWLRTELYQAGDWRRFLQGLSKWAKTSK